LDVINTLLFALGCFLSAPIAAVVVYAASQDTFFAYITAAVLLFLSFMFAVEYAMKRQNMPIITPPLVRRQTRDKKQRYT
jgi:uncharacterized membrane protein